MFLFDLESVSSYNRRYPIIIPLITNSFFPKTILKPSAIVSYEAKKLSVNSNINKYSAGNANRKEFFGLLIMCASGCGSGNTAVNMQNTYESKIAGVSNILMLFEVTPS